MAWHSRRTKVEYQSKPACFPSQEVFNQWKALARSSGDQFIKRNGYCADCTPEFKAEMMGKDLCAYRRTSFFTDQDGFISGRRNGAEILERAERKDEGAQR